MASSGSGSSTGWRMNGSRLGPADPAVERDQLLERAALLEIRVVEAADHDVGHVREPVRAEQVARRVRGERRQRVLALDRSVGEVVSAVGPERDRAALRGADEEPADVRVRAECRDQPRVALVDLLEREPARLLHQRDQPEVARAEHDDFPIRHVLLRALALLLVRLARSPRRRRARPSHAARRRRRSP